MVMGPWEGASLAEPGPRMKGVQSISSQPSIQVNLEPALSVGPGTFTEKTSLFAGKPRTAPSGDQTPRRPKWTKGLI